MPRSMPGRFRPFRDRSSPPTATRHRTSSPSTPWTISCTRPSFRNSRSPGFTTRGRRANDTETREAVPGTCSRREREGVAGPELDRLGLDRADAHLRPRQVGHDGHAAPGGRLCGADARDAAGVIRERPVREVQPRDIHSRADQALEHVGRIGRRADGGDDSGLVRRQHSWISARARGGREPVEFRHRERARSRCTARHPAPSSRRSWPRRCRPGGVRGPGTRSPTRCDCPSAGRDTDLRGRSRCRRSVPTQATQSPFVALSRAMSRKVMKRRPSGAYLATCRSPVSAPGSSRGAVQVRPSSFEKITKEFSFRLFSRRSTAICLPSGDRMAPGSHRWADGMRDDHLGRPPGQSAVSGDRLVHREHAGARPRPAPR